MAAYPKFNVGILGGSFNPPHLGHLHISNLAIKTLKLQKLIWLVSPQNPIKSNSPEHSFLERINLCKDITRKNPKIEVSSLELDYNRNSKKFFTYNFLKRFKAQNLNYNIKLIIGADNLINFHLWHQYKKISQLAEIIVFNRDSGGNLKYKALQSKFGWSGKYKFINAKMIKISSSEIRKSK